MTYLNLNKHLQDSDNGAVALTSEAWETAIDVVNYPVKIVNAFYEVERDGRVDYEQATGETTTGRDKHINLVLVDRLRSGNFQAIQAVTGVYGTTETQEVYKNLRDQINSLDHQYDLNEVYVSGNGGSQTLVLTIKGLDDAKGCKDTMEMRVALHTSIDGSKAHTMNVLAHSVEGKFDWNVFGTENSLKARHTTTIGARTIDFVPRIMQMVEQWNDLIMPTMNLLCDQKYDARFAKELLDEVATKADIGQRHREKIAQIWEERAVRTNEDYDSLYTINAAIAQYIDEELDDKRDRKELFRNNLSKQVQKELDQQTHSRKLRHKSAK